MEELDKEDIRWAGWLTRWAKASKWTFVIISDVSIPLLAAASVDLRSLLG